MSTTSFKILKHSETMGEDSAGKQSLELSDLPDSLLLEVCSFLCAQDLGHLACTSSRFNRIVSDDLLWKGVFRRRFKIPRSVPVHPRASSWRSEHRRLWDESPSVLCEEMNRHKDQVLHVSFSHNGQMFATCSKDGKVMVWSSTHPITLRFCANLSKEFSWRYTQYSQFNKADTLLLVSGVFHGNLTTSGEIVVFDLQDFEPQCRVINKPYDVFGCWYDNLHLFSGSLYWTGHLQSISALWLNKASQAVESERESVMMNLYRFSNINASSIRTIMVADVPVIEAETSKPDDAMHADCTYCVCAKCSEDSECLCRESNTNNSSCDYDGSGEVVNVDRIEEQEGESGVGEVDSSAQLDSLDCDSGQKAGTVPGVGQWQGEHSVDTLVSESSMESVSGQGEDSMETVQHLWTGDHTGVSTSASASHEVCLDSERTLGPDSKVQGVSTAEGGRSCTSDSGWDGGDGLNPTPAKHSCLHSVADSQMTPAAADSHSSSASGVSSGVSLSRHSASSSGGQSGDLSHSVQKPHGSEADDSQKVASDFLNSPPTSEASSLGASIGATASASAPPGGASGAAASSPKHMTDIPRTSSSVGPGGRSLCTEKLLIFTMGEETYTPHLIGIKRMRRQDIRGEEEGTAVELGEGDGEENLLPNVDQNFQGMDRPPTTVDHTINMHGHIVGMALSPDQRYLYVNSRQWPQNYHIEKVLEPPPIAQEIDIHVIDLVTLQEVGTIMRSHKAFTPNDECFFLFLDVSELYVASGAEDKRGYLWDRHYGVHLHCYPHSDVVNSVAFNPLDQEMLITVSDDNKIKVWRSRRRMRELGLGTGTEYGTGV